MRFERNTVQRDWQMQMMNQTVEDLGWSEWKPQMCERKYVGIDTEVYWKGWTDANDYLEC